jgi:hypothetical protein
MYGGNYCWGRVLHHTWPWACPWLQLLKPAEVRPMFDAWRLDLEVQEMRSKLTLTVSGIPTAPVGS